MQDVADCVERWSRHRVRLRFLVISRRLPTYFVVVAKELALTSQSELTGSGNKNVACNICSQLLQTQTVGLPQEDVPIAIMKPTFSLFESRPRGTETYPSLWPSMR
jgi:hypothetical protein